MAKYAGIHHKVTLFGDMFSGTEQWTTGFSMNEVGGGPLLPDPTVAEATAIANAWAAIWTPAANGFSNLYRFLGCKVAAVNAEGVSDPGVTAWYYRPAPVAGGAGPTNAPQVSLAATLTTNIARGRGSKGRMFLPGVGFSVGADGKITAAQATTIAGQIKAFMDVINAAADVPGVVSLQSQEVTGVPFKASAANQVTGVKVGTVYDTQRRRRNNLVEIYSTAALA
jgi:hypothetical protein